MRVKLVLTDIRRKVRRFVQAENGTATVEFVFMVPLFTTLVLLVTDASLLFLRHSTLMNVSRDTARVVSLHAMTPAEAQVYAAAAASTMKSAATAQVTIANGFVTVILSSDAASSAPFGIISYAVGDTISAVAISTMEPI
ncbi:TadE family protein [Tabrizicola sp.]|uniref:TadE/TadG family type IV pilus assembly protein n=1 Tax=Tabrizicola sp. TaxID=2005166 RepID=UPI002605B967|nr:TadE family protein [Tabrizicola sp.]MDM7933572.1 pilus assembly protein [Tabrizicola sp.]